MFARPRIHIVPARAGAAAAPAAELLPVAAAMRECGTPTAVVASLLLVIGTAVGQSPSDPSRGVPGMTCHHGLLYPNASQSSEILADYNFNFMSELAINSSVWAGENGADCNKSEYKCSAIGYQWCTAGPQCGCLAGNSMGYLISSLGAGNPVDNPAVCDDPCWCTALLPQYRKAHSMGNSSGCIKYSCDEATGTCSAGKTGNYTTNSTCSSGCAKPAPPPPPPLAQNPCIRFGHTIPVADHVDAMIVQDDDPTINHTWTDMRFGDFSDWVNVFRAGTGTITLWENTGGKRGKQLFRLPKIPLTPGPLVAIVKVAQSQPKPVWPPSLPDNIETIAASCESRAASHAVELSANLLLFRSTATSLPAYYCSSESNYSLLSLVLVDVSSKTSAAVRLFNLSPDTKDAGMSLGAKELVKNVAFSLGSPWVDVPAASASFTFTDSLTAKEIAALTHTPPAAPLGFTNFLLGMQSPGAAGGAYEIRALALTDAPEGGVCKPTAGL